MTHAYICCTGDPDAGPENFTALGILVVVGAVAMIGLWLWFRWIARRNERRR